MKKIIAFLLATVMCLSFATCGGDSVSTEKKIIGTWETKNELQYVINEDQTGTILYKDDEVKAEFTWVYDEATRIISLTTNEDKGTTLTYLEVNDTLIHYSLGVFHRVK